MTKTSMHNILTQFKERNLLHDRPTATIEDLKQLEQELSFQFPNDFVEAVTTTTIEKGTFHYVKPYRIEEYPDYVAFAMWNYNVFMFDTREKERQSIYVFVPGIAPEKKYETFLDWLLMVLEASKVTTQPD